MLSLPRARVQSLVRELRYHKLHSQKQTNKQTKTEREREREGKGKAGVKNDFKHFGLSNLGYRGRGKYWSLKVQYVIY